jgi:hypothetical protein
MPRMKLFIPNSQPKPGSKIPESCFTHVTWPAIPREGEGVLYYGSNLNVQNVLHEIAPHVEIHVTLEALPENKIVELIEEGHWKAG